MDCEVGTPVYPVARAARTAAAWARRIRARTQDTSGDFCARAAIRMCAVAGINPRR